MFDGPAPIVKLFIGPDQEQKAVGQWISQRLAEGCLPHEIGVFVRSDAELPRARAAVNAANVSAVELTDRGYGVRR